MTAKKPKRDLAMLVGNGLSIAFNESLRLEAITAEVINRLTALGHRGDEVVNTMGNIARRVGARTNTPARNFEDLVGVFESEQLNLDYLGDLAKLVSPEDTQLATSFDKVLSFTERVQRVGLSHVLEVINNRTYGSHYEADDLHKFIDEVAICFTGRVTISNLNYDTLLLSALIARVQQDFADLGHGSNFDEITISPGRNIRGNALRRLDDIPDKFRVRLIHLHGSLTYWMDRASGVMVKLTKAQIDEHKLFKILETDSSAAKPLVVLSSVETKHEKIQQEPFKLAYELFEKSIESSRKWLIVGYSFRDPSVNTRLKDAFHASVTKPSILIVTLGGSPTELEISEALELEDFDFGLSVTVFRDGASQLIGSVEWQDFARSSGFTEDDYEYPF